MQIKDLGPQHLGQVFTVNDRGVQVTGQLSMVRHEAEFVADRMLCQAESARVIGGVASHIRLGHHEVSVGGDAEVAGR